MASPALLIEPSVWYVVCVVCLACPFVAGVASLYLNGHPTASHSTVKASLMCSATNDVLSNQPPSTANLLLYANVQPCASAASSSSSGLADFTAMASSSAAASTDPATSNDPLEALPPSSPLQPGPPLMLHTAPSDIDGSTLPSFSAADDNATDWAGGEGGASNSSGNSTAARNGSNRLAYTRTDTRTAVFLWIVTGIMLAAWQIY